MAWWEKAASHGFVRAKSCLAGAFHQGRGVAQNHAMAVAWWEKAAVGGSATSQYILGLAYSYGAYGLPKNAQCAKIFMMAAADPGAAATDQGQPRHADASKALKVLRACAACGTPDASRACQGCKTVTSLSTVRYCNPECQKAHWKAHTADCGGLQACACHRCKIDRGESGA